MTSRKQRILIVEGDQRLREFMLHLLGAEGFQQEQAINAADALACFEEQRPDLILLNLQLPGLSGLELCRRIRQQSLVPIIALSSLSDRSDKLSALELGADDYMALPFDVDELLARVRALLRRSTPPPAPSAPEVLRAGHLEINLPLHQVLRDGVDVPLSRIEWALLELLIRHAGKVLPHRLILQQVWGDAYSEEVGYLRTYVGRLRNKLEEDPERPRYLTTAPRIGYSFVLDPRGAPLQAVAEARPGAPAVSATGQPPAEPVPLAKAPPAATSDFTGLPLQPTSFFGREGELTAIKELLCNPNVSLVTLTGPGGAGKTRLAIHAAASLRWQFRDGVTFVPLGALRDSALVPSAIARALGLKASPAEPPQVSLAAYLGGRQLLLVLDNFEQLGPAAIFVAELLGAAQGLKVLATSRSPLQLYGEHAYSVPPLALPSLRRLPSLEVLATAPAVALFVARAQATKAGFSLSADNAPAIVEICHRLDGLPLAIELAAARVRILPPQAMVTRMSQRLRLLTGGSRDLPERQQTLRGMIDWSYELLEPDERLLFRRLAVFVGGCSLAAIEAVCGAVAEQLAPVEDLLRSLEGLLDQSLLQQWDAPGDEEPRFVMLETIQEYALEQLARSEEPRQLQQRHAGYYLALAERAAPELDGSDQQCWLAQLEREHGNMRAALEWAIAQADADLALRLAGALWKFWRFYGHHREGRRWLEQVLALPGSSDLALRTHVLQAAGWIVYDQGDAEQAGVWYAESLALAEQLGDRRGVGLALQGIGEIAQTKGAYAQAQRCFEQSLAIVRELGDLEETAWSLDHLGQSMLYQGQLAHSEQLHHEALALFRQLTHSWGIAITLMHLGETLFYQGELARALTLMEECLERSRELGDIRNPLYAFSLTLVGELRFYQGEVGLARALLDEGLALSDEGGFLWCASQAHGALALLERAAGALDVAADHVRRGLAIQQRLRQLRRVVLLLEDAAGVAAARGADPVAAELYGAAAGLRGQSGLSQPAPELPRYEREVAALRQRLTPPLLADAWDKGGRLDLDQAIARALALLDEGRARSDLRVAT